MPVKSWIVAWVAFLTWLHALETVACVICVPYPKTTLADRLMKTESVVLAREKIGHPYTFTPVEILKGSGVKKDIEAFVDSASRRKLNLVPEDAVVLGRETPDADWLLVAYADVEVQKFIRAMLTRSASWSGPEGGKKRITFFADYLTSDNPLIYQQAYLEVGRAPYSSIKSLAGAVPRDRIRAFLDDWRLMEWHSLYILMLGQSRHPDDLDYIRTKFEAIAKHGLKLNLSAWATAFIEAYPDTALDEIERLYFENESRTREELEEVGMGLSVLGSEDIVLGGPGVAARRRRIVRSYAVLLENHPVMAGRVAKDLAAWKIRALVDRLSGIVKAESGLDPDSTFAVNYYLSMAPRYLP
jgi:hypothetical protein